MMDINAFLESKPNETLRLRLLCLAIALQNGGWLNETPLTVHIGGESARGAEWARNAIRGAAFLGFLNRRKKGRAQYYQAAQFLLDWARTQAEFSKFAKDHAEFGWEIA